MRSPRSAAVGFQPSLDRADARLHHRSDRDARGGFVPTKLAAGAAIAARVEHRQGLA